MHAAEEAKPGMALKDLDWCRGETPAADEKFDTKFSKTNAAKEIVKEPRRRMALGLARDALLEHVRDDTRFLANHGLIDYSLLVGVHRPRGGKVERREEAEPSQIASTTQNAIYFCGLIDMLIPYGAKKRAEHIMKARLGIKGSRQKLSVPKEKRSHGYRHEHGTSIVPPHEYAQRMLNFVERITTAE